MLQGGHGERSGSTSRSGAPRSRSPHSEAAASSANGGSVVLSPPALSFPAKGAAKGAELSPQDMVAQAVQEHIGTITQNLVGSMQPAVAELVTKVATQCTSDLVDRMGHVESGLGEVQSGLQEVRG